MPALALHCPFARPGSHYLLPGSHNSFTGVLTSIRCPTVIHIGHWDQTDLVLQLVLLLSIEASVYLLVPPGGKFRLLSMLRKSFAMSPPQSDPRHVINFPSSAHMSFLLCPSVISRRPSSSSLKPSQLLQGELVLPPS